MKIQKKARLIIRLFLRTLLSWSKLKNPTPGFSIILGTPWALRELLEVNLRFVAHTNPEGFERMYIMFDRRKQSGAEKFIAEVREKFPDLPLEFHFYPAIVGALVERVNQSKFYATLCWVLGLRKCQSRYAILHDFDLYPIKENYFNNFISTIEKDGFRMCGLENTKFGGLKGSDKILATWGLAIDVPWIREKHHPIDCFHVESNVLGRSVEFDPFARLQVGLSERGLVEEINENEFAHVTNLVSTHLRFNKGEPVTVAWRLNYLWYLESLVANSSRMEQVTKKMIEANSPELEFESHVVDFSAVHYTCGNVLAKRVMLMEKFLFGKCRKEVKEYVNAFSTFLLKYGESAPVKIAA